jgi:methanogenic corrinoid protein MtbC1
MVGDLFELSGWRVRSLGTNLPPTSIIGVIRETAPSYVGIFRDHVVNVNAVRQLIASIRSEFDHRAKILVGGAAFKTSPQLWRQGAADAFASDLREAQALLQATG